MPDRIPPRYASGPPPRRQPDGGAVPGGARAPYNFVPLPEKIRPADEPPAGDCYHDDAGRYTGSIDLDITTKTPLYLRGTVDAAHLAGDTPAPGFFAPSGRAAIPGSSLRGMLRTLVEIISASAFVTDYAQERRFAYRTVADPASPLGQTYRQRIGQVYAGHLEQRSDGLRMLPAKQALGQRFWQVKQDVLRRQFGLDVEQNQFSRLRVYFEPTDRRCGKNSQLCCVDQVQPATGAIPAHWLSGWLILSGFIEKKSHSWIIADPDEGRAPLPVPEWVKDDYLGIQAEALREATRRVSAAERFPLLPEGAERIPCFYTLTTQQGTPEVSAFGHTRWFRLNYQRSVGDAVPAALRLSRTGDSAAERPQGQEWD
ncbi:MAG TPA: RAMP superfamily CRISPR-associated protein, partial [Chloroflexota bacterium]